MLVALRIESLAIIDVLEVRFEKGLNVLTGETGAGKSILVDALHLLLGGRADPGVIRSGCEEAVVEGLFVGEGLHEKVQACGLPSSGDELLIRRVVARGGRGRVYVNGSLATVAILSSLTRGLVDVSGQHEHVSLLRRERQGELLDAFAGATEPKRQYEAVWERLARMTREEEALQRATLERARRREFLEFQLKEFEELAPIPGELDSLAEERQALAATEKLRDVATSVEDAIWSAEGAAGDRIAWALKRLDEAARLDKRLAPVAQLLHSARVELEEAARELSGYASRLVGDPGRLTEIDERLEALRRLSRKQGGSLEAALERAEEMRTELLALGGDEARAEGLGAEIQAAADEACRLADALGSLRREAAETLCASVAQEIHRLGLSQARLSVTFEPVAEGVRVGDRWLSRQGAETTEFLFAANPGEAPRPLASTASGGELSRLLLGWKRVLSRVDPVETLVFDEADTGISGAAALTVGEMLKEAARERQVLCVTHLPQVAAYADVHLHVSKKVEEGRTHSGVERLDWEGRRRSLARMLAGSDRRPAALAAAAELLESVAGKGGAAATGNMGSVGVEGGAAATGSAGSTEGPAVPPKGRTRSGRRATGAADPAGNRAA